MNGKEKQETLGGFCGEISEEKSDNRRGRKGIVKEGMDRKRTLY